MAVAKSKVTEEGQLPVPAEIQEKLGLAPGSIVEWEEDGDRVYVRRRSAADEFHEIHKALFPDGPPEPRTLEELKEAIPKYVREKYGRRR